MKKIVVLFLLIPLIAACSKVPAGYKGVKVYLLGGEKGVESEELGVGRYWIGINEDLYLFPTFTQNYVWTKDVAEGSPNDESVTFQTIEGLSVSADIGISYAVDPAKVTDIFQKYRKGIDEITDIYLRNMVRDALVTAASTREIATVYGAGKADLIGEVEDAIRTQVQEIGIVIERIYWIGELRLPATVVASIDAKIQATQKAQQRQNEVAQARAEAEKLIEAARGTAESRLINARAEAEANQIIAGSLTATLVQYQAIQTWNGELPRFTGDGAIPLINMDQR